MPHSIDTEVTDIEPPKQIVNDGELDPSQVSFLRRSTTDLSLEELHYRFQEDGYLFIKGLLPRDAVLKAREEYFKFLEPTGVLKPGTKPIDGIFDDEKDRLAFPGIGAGAAGGNGHPGDHAAAFVDRALLAHYQDWYAEDLCKHPALKEFISKLTGWGNNTTAFVRTLLRNNVPGNKAIGVHYDQIFLRHGEPTSITAWVPIGDIRLDGGGLIYLERGHLLGIEQEKKFTDEAKASGLTEEEAKSAFNHNMMSTGLLSEGPKEFAQRFDRRWLVSEYEAGDIVLHNPFAIHASTLNNSKDNKIRLATDLRFVDSSRPWDTVSKSSSRILQFTDEMIEMVKAVYVRGWCVKGASFTLFDSFLRQHVESISVRTPSSCFYGPRCYCKGASRVSLDEMCMAASQTGSAVYTLQLLTAVGRPISAVIASTIQK